MKTTSIQISVTDKEYAKLQAEAEKLGVSVADFVKTKALQNDEFEVYFQKLLAKVKALPKGAKFNLKALFGAEWTMSAGVKLSLGKVYFNKVTKGVITDAIADGKDGNGVMWYEKQ